MTRVALLVLAGVLAPLSPAAGQLVVFRGVGDLPGGGVASRALGVGVGPGGVVVVGDSMASGGWRGFRWTLVGGLENLGVLAVNDQFSLASAVSSDGSVIVGSSGFAPSVFECQGFRWSSSTGMQAIGPFAAPLVASLPNAVSATGEMIVGEGGMTPGSPFAFRAGPAGIFSLGALPGADPDYSAAHAVSADGSVIAGRGRTAAWETTAIRWTQGSGMVGLGHLNTSGFLDSRAYGCSQDGLVIVGESTSENGPQEAFRWTNANMLGLGDLPGGAFRSAALAVSENGNVVVGWSEAAGGNRAFIWDPSHGMRDLKQVLVARGWNVGNWVLLRATAVSNGKVVGVGLNPAGQAEGWISDLGCYADCNQTGTFTIADFACFQNAFGGAQPYADCNGDGGLTISDFSCFQAKFVQASTGGCP